MSEVNQEYIRNMGGAIISPITSTKSVFHKEGDLYSLLEDRNINTYYNPSQIDPSLDLSSDILEICKRMKSKSVLWFYTGEPGSEAFNESIYNLCDFSYTQVLVLFRSATRCKIFVFLSGRADYWYGDFYWSSNQEPRLIWNHVGDEPWKTAELLNGYENYNKAFNTVQYRREGNRVFLRGMFTKGTLALPLFKLPEGYRPSKELEMTAIVLSTVITEGFIPQNEVLRNCIEIQRNGDVVPGRYYNDKRDKIYSWASIDGLSFSLD